MFLSGENQYKFVTGMDAWKPKSGVDKANPPNDDVKSVLDLYYHFESITNRLWAF